MLILFVFLLVHGLIEIPLDIKLPVIRTYYNTTVKLENRMNVIFK